jgi:hypothetical protein
MVKLLLISISLSFPAFATGPYYIDCVNGSDSNAGTSTSTAWKHHPYMVGWTGNYTHVPGDQFYFKGGVTCPNSYFPLTVAAGGSSSTYDYYGPDPTQSWYTGSAWARPIFSGGSAVIGTQNIMINGGSINYWQIDNFEVTGFTNYGTNSYQYNSIFLANGQYFKWTNNYIHAWVNTTSLNDTIDIFMGCNGCSSAPQVGAFIDHNYIDGADATPAGNANGNGSAEAIRYIDGGTISNNVIMNVGNCLVSGQTAITLTGNVLMNVWESFDSAIHENGFEMQTDGNVIANNVVTNVNGGFVLVLAPKGNTDWVYNNVFWNSPYSAMSIDTQGSYPTYAANFYNNTISAGNYYCIDTTDRGASNLIGAMNVVNNLCITTSGTLASSFCFAGNTSCSTVTTVTETTNVLLTTSAATAQGYTSSETFVYSPTASTNSTVGTGTNETSLCSGSEASLCSDTSYCAITSGNVVSCPARAEISRPSGTAWDAGAYQFQAASSGGGGGPCDLNQDGVVNVLDVQLAINMDLGLLTCTADIDGAGICNSTVVQRVVNASLGSACVVTPTVSLNWTASTSPNVAGYNVYRGTTSGGPYVILNSSLVAGTGYTDNAAQSGVTYYYVTTAVDTSNNTVSAYSNEAQAVVP